jgi:predicted enzyme related to lactoylglutathione lyase
MADYAPGTPSWVDLASPDPDKSASFYGDLFGWETTEPGPVEETGGYRMFTQGGKMVAGLGPIMQEGQPSVWTTYISTDSADDTAAKVRDGGGQVFVEPMDIMEAGRMGIFADPAGAVFGVWQPGEHRGAELVNEPVSLEWNELATRDTDSSSTFYSAVFGWRPDVQEFGGQAYTLWMLGDRPIAGMMAMGDQFPADVPPHWAVYFAVDDTDATVEKAKGLGANVIAGPMDIPSVGRFAALFGPTGEPFSVIKPAAPPPGDG